MVVLVRNEIALRLETGEDTINYIFLLNILLIMSGLLLNLEGIYGLIKNKIALNVYKLILSIIIIVLCVIPQRPIFDLTQNSFVLIKWILIPLLYPESRSILLLISGYLLIDSLSNRGKLKN